jgi:hypothetical protein
MKKLLIGLLVLGSFSSYACFDGRSDLAIIKKATLEDCSLNDLEWAQSKIPNSIKKFESFTESSDPLRAMTGVASIGALKASLSLIKLEIQNRNLGLY